MEKRFYSHSRPSIWSRTPALTLQMSSKVIQMVSALPNLVSHFGFQQVALPSYTCLLAIKYEQLLVISGHFCGKQVPKPVLSSSNEMVVRFKSNSNDNAKGFSAVYTVSSSPPVTSTTTKPATTITNKPTTTPEPTGEC